MASGFVATGTPVDGGPSLVELPTWADGSWDEATIEGKLIPGLVKVEPKRGVKYDVKEAPGATGAKVSFKGFGAATFKLVVRMWTATQEGAFAGDILPLIEPTPGKESPKGFAFIHPATALRKIDGILVESVEGPKVDDGGQWVEWSIDAFEYRKPVKQQGGPPGKPAGSNCQELKAAYDQSVVYLQIAQVEYNNILANVGTAEQIAQSNARLIQAQTDVQYTSQALADNKCNEASGGSDAAAGNTPDP